ncbi:MAG: S1 RNA-binding domain-containing protein, partial [Chloroflexota bacterium]
MAEDVDFSAELEQYLDQHDYDMPRPGDIRTGTILDISERGAIIGLGLKRDGFVPADDLSKLTEEEREALVVDSEVPVYVVDTGQHDSLTVSIHRALIYDDWIKAEGLVGKDDVVEAEVVGYNRGGALVDYGRLRGFIPLSQLAAFRPGMKDRDKQRMLSKLRGEVLPLKVIEVDRRRRRLVMSNREAQREYDDSRRAERLENLNGGDTLNGVVSSLRDFGAFVDIGDGIEGLVHVSELAWHRIDHPSEVISVGDEIEVYVLKVDTENNRISLSRKRLLPDPWTLVEQKYDVNSLVEGVVTRIVNYGAFVEIEPGIEGLLHSSKMVRGSDTADPEKIVQVGEKHLLRVINIDSDK